MHRRERIADALAAGSPKERHLVACPQPLGLWLTLTPDTSAGESGRALAGTEAAMMNAPRISRAQAVALPRPAPTPRAVTEWIVAGIAVALLLAGLIL